LVVVDDAVGSGDARFYRRVALATVLPGAGLLRTRWRPLGIVLLVLFLAAAGYVGYRAWTGGGVLDAALYLAVDPDALRFASVVVAVAVVVWVGSVVLTAELSRPHPPRRGAVWRSLFALAACALLVVPGALVVQYLDVQADLISSVFVSRPAPAVVGEKTPTATPTPEPSADPWAGTKRVNLVLLGSDAGKNRIGVRTDSMMVVSINTRTGDTVLIGVPRNLEKVPIPERNPLHAIFPYGYDCGDECLMNGIWTLADSRPDLFPGDPSPGLTSTIDVLSAVTGLPIEHSAVIDLSGFRELVDAMGGVDINVRERVCVSCHLTEARTFEWTSDAHEWIEPGLQHLDGRLALWYARSRATSDDFSRMRRQRCVAGALIEQADPVSLLARYPRIARAVKDNVSIDIPPDQLPAWVELVQRIQSRGSIRSLPLTNDVIDPADPDFDLIHTLVKRALRAPARSTETPTAGPTPSGTSTRTRTPRPTPTSSLDPLTAQDLAATC
jgi:LCP family protein required for cell wall assembly